MKKLLTFLFAFLASIGLMNAEQVTISWGLDNADSQLSGTCTSPKITVSDVTYASGLTLGDVKTYGDGGTLFHPVTTGNYTSPFADGSRILTFAFSIPDGYSFKPGQMSFFSAADGSGNPHLIDVFFNNDNTRFVKGHQPNKSSVSPVTTTVSLSDIELSGDNTLKMDLYGKDGGTSKGWTIGHVEIIGDLVNLSDNRENANISWSVPSTSLKVRDAFTAPFFNNPDNVPVTFSSSNENVAVIDENGNISLVEGGLGTAMISATYDGEAAGAQYQTTTANTTIEVITNVKDVNAQVEYEKVESIQLNDLFTVNETDNKKSLAAGNLIDDDNITIKTVYAANYSNYGKEYLGNKFAGSVQLGRVANAPSEDNKNGTENSGNSPIIITPNVDCKVVMFIRRQTLEQTDLATEVDDVANNVITRTHYYGMSPNDGKSVWAVAHSDINTKLDQNLVFGTYNDAATDYMYCAIEWDLKASETYTLYALNTTIAMNGIGYYTEVTEEPEDPWVAEYPHTWDFSNWSDATVANLKADNNWSDIESATGTEPTEASKDNCFWQASASKGLSPNKYVKANRITIDELYGLTYLNTNDRSLALAVNYTEPNAAGGFGPYHGASYLWLGGKTEVDYFTIPGVPAGATIKMGVESHKLTDARGVKLTVDGVELKAPNGEAVAAPTEYAEQVWTVPTSAAESNDVKVSITNGCHLYFITVTPPTKEIVEYTIQYKANGALIEGKDKKKTGLEGDPVELTEEDKASFSIVNGNLTTTYTYASDDSEGKTINSDGSTVVTVTMTATEKKVNTLYSWDFTNWSEATVNNLMEGTNWSDIEKADGTAPTELSKDNCFWQVNYSNDLTNDKNLMANSVVIPELEGLVYTNQQTQRSLAIAVNYQVAGTNAGFGPYEGASYLWLGGNKINYFIIPNVPAGATIKMGVESHNTTKARGVELSISGTKLTAPDGSAVATPTVYTEQEWLVPAEAAELNDVQIYNTDGCHIYYITVTHPELQKYTLRYVAGEETLKEVKKFGTVGEAITLTTDDKASFNNADETAQYVFDSVEPENAPVGEDGNTVVTIYMKTLEFAPISWSAESTSLKIRDEFTAPTLNNEEGLAVTFESSNPEVATVGENGVISLTEGGLGTAVISATYNGEAEGSKYLTTTVSTTLEVITNVVEAYAWAEYENVESIPLTNIYTVDKTSGSLEAGNLIDDEHINIKTVYSAKYNGYGKEYLGKKFAGSIQLGRVDAAPTTDNLYGTEKADNSPIVVTPNVDCKLVMFLRRQALEQEVTEDDDVENNVITRTHLFGMSPNDGKSVYAVAHSDIATQLPQNLVFGAYGADKAAGNNDYIFCAVEWELKAGETYTIYTRGTTPAVNAIGYYIDVTGLNFENEVETVTMGEVKALTANIESSNPSLTVPIKWETSNPEVASVDEEGNVTGIAVGSAEITATCLDFTATCTVKVYPRTGDADKSGRITINDAVDISNYVVGKKEVAAADLEFYLVAANANEDEDGEITFADASAAAELALSEPDAETPEAEQARIRAFGDDSMDTLVIGRADATSRGSVVPVALANSQAYVALQADIILPEGMSVDVKAGSRAASTHTMMTRKHADNHIRVVFFNLANDAFAAGEAPMFEIVTDSYISASDIVISTVLASDADANEHVLAARVATSTAVEAIGLDGNAPVKVYDVNGMYVGDSMEGLQQGTYIVRQGDAAKTVRIR